MKLNELLTCSRDSLNEKLNFIDSACNGIALMNSLIEYQKTLNNTDNRNRCPITGYVLQKLCSLNGLHVDYSQAYNAIITARLNKGVL